MSSTRTRQQSNLTKKQLNYVHYLDIIYQVYVTRRTGKYLARYFYLVMWVYILTGSFSVPGIDAKSELQVFIVKNRRVHPTLCRRVSGCSTNQSAVTSITRPGTQRYLASWVYICCGIITRRQWIRCRSKNIIDALCSALAEKPKMVLCESCFSMRTRGRSRGPTRGLVPNTALQLCSFICTSLRDVTFDRSTRRKISRDYGTIHTPHPK